MLTLGPGRNGVAPRFGLSRADSVPNLTRRMDARLQARPHLADELQQIVAQDRAGNQKPSLTPRGLLALSGAVTHPLDRSADALCNGLGQPQCLFSLGRYVSAEPRRPPSPLDEPLTFQRLQLVPHVMHEHLGSDGQARIVHIVGRIPLQISEGPEDQPLAAFEFHGRFPV